MQVIKEQKGDICSLDKLVRAGSPSLHHPTSVFDVEEFGGGVVSSTQVWKLGENIYSSVSVSKLQPQRDRDTPSS